MIPQDIFQHETDEIKMEEENNSIFSYELFWEWKGHSTTYP